jgi:hypothetical protein
LLLSIDPQDPMGVLCAIDYYALMSEQYAFIPRLLADFDSSDCSLALRPGTAFSLALSRFRLEERTVERTEKTAVTGGEEQQQSADASEYTRASLGVPTLHR